MQLLKNLLSKVRPHFEEGGKLEKYYYGYDALETFLFVPGHSTHKGETHIKDGIDLKRTMFVVVIAMVPCLLFGIWNVGHQYYLAAGEFTGIGEGLIDKILHGSLKVLPIVLVSYGVGGIIEGTFAIIRKHSINEGFLVTGMLIPLVMPPTIPLWMVAIATAFAILIGKEAFGGTGMNILNVALTARVFVFFAYPTYIAGDQVWIADGVTGATPLGVGYLDGIAGLQAHPHYSLENIALGLIPGSIGETSFLAIAAGAFILIASGVGSWKIMLSVIAGGLATATALFLFDITPFSGVPPYYHMFMGSMLFAAVFMATDPVTAAQTEMGKWIYGFLIGVFGIIIRVLNPAYPEGWMLAILLMNVFAPTIDHMIVQSNIKRRLSRALE